mmetsp:Transcript_34011/g.71545  ORF Transcript_34011/g.71545 Transcript_34011/m.71545 type:complete len:87 (-) Transcript_34011:752-1012(-)
MQLSNYLLGPLISTTAAFEITDWALITPSTSCTIVQNALNRSPGPQATPFLINGASLNEEFSVQLRHEILLQELQGRKMEQNRQRT